LINDFSTLENPELDFDITYKITDNSSIEEYNDTGYTDGYNNTIKQTVDAYKLGTLDRNDPINI
jgi:hypothetical protein